VTTVNNEAGTIYGFISVTLIIIYFTITYNLLHSEWIADNSGKLQLMMGVFTFCVFVLLKSLNSFPFLWSVYSVCIQILLVIMFSVVQFTCVYIRFMC
jgi:hypothetical protein